MTPPGGQLPAARLSALLVGADPPLDANDAIDAGLDLAERRGSLAVAEVVLDRLALAVVGRVLGGDRRQVGHLVVLVRIGEAEVVVLAEQLPQRAELLRAEVSGRLALGLHEVGALVLDGTVAIDRDLVDRAPPEARGALD